LQSRALSNLSVEGLEEAEGSRDADKAVSHISRWLSHLSISVLCNIAKARHDEPKNKNSNSKGINKKRKERKNLDMSRNRAMRISETENSPGLSSLRIKIMC
jgi:hypothetical protein